MEEKVTINNEIGLHARLAAHFIQVSNSYRSDIFVEKDGTLYNGKSLMSILSMGAVKGDVISLHISGEDEREAMNNLKALFDKEIAP